MASVFFGPIIGPNKIHGPGVYPAQQELCKPDFELLLVIGFEAERPSRQAAADKERLLAPGDTPLFCVTYVLNLHRQSWSATYPNFFILCVEIGAHINWAVGGLRRVSR